MKNIAHSGMVWAEREGDVEAQMIFVSPDRHLGASLRLAASDAGDDRTRDLVTA